MSFEIVPFSDDYLGDAASLVATRYRGQRALQPSLPARFERSDAVLPRLQDLAKRGTGVAAIRGGRCAGFLLGIHYLAGGARSVWSPDWGHAVDSVDGPDTYREMYASASRRWILDERYSHLVTVLAHDREAVHAWFSLGFGLVVIDALRDVSPVQDSMAKLDIRRAEPEDIELWMTLQVELRRHLTTAPIFIPLITDRRWEFYEKWISDSASALWMAYYDGATVAFIGLQPSAQHDTVMPVSAENTVAISWAFTEERVRRGGVGTALLNHSLTWAQSLGYENCSVDFESANILASRFWLGRGFQPVCYSLARHVDNRIAWAYEERDDTDLS